MSELNPDGISVKGCKIIYAPAGQAGEYSPLAANPYRGCGHKCAYCLSGDTAIAMADGSTKPIRDIDIGESVIGVTQDRTRRAWGTRITTTTVLAKVRSVKRAYRVSLEDGTEAVCSADHRWLTERGWKYTVGCRLRGGLTANNVIRTLCGAVVTPPETVSYRLGYIAGIVEGDGSIGVYDYSHKRRRSGKTMGVQHRFRLALKDTIGLQRTQRYLSSFGIATTESDFAAETETRAAIGAIGTCSPASVAKIKELTIPLDDPEWERGWLAGIFDAEGSYGREALRISNTDERLLSITEQALSNWGFRHTRDFTPPTRASVIRLLGGRAAELRFWQLCNPAISRKFDLDGQAIAESVPVYRVESLGLELEMFDIMTGTENFVANGMVSHNCYVPGVLRMDRREFDAGAVPRPNFLRYLEADAMKYRALGITEQCMLSFTTDPFHPGDNALTRDVLQTLQAYGLGICTLTKGGSRALRDIDLFRPGRDAFASTLTSLENGFSKKWERDAALPEDRMNTLRTFHESGIFTWVSLEPTLDTASTLEIIRRTHTYVDMYKVGRVNYVGLTNTINWKQFTHDVLQVLADVGARFYIKKDLQPFLPPDFHNPMRVKQFREEAPGAANQPEQLRILS